MLEFILGEAGSGKTALLFDRIKNASGSKQPILLLVPDQFVFENEKRIAEMLCEHTENVSVCGFSSLCRKVLKEEYTDKKTADNTAKLITMQRTVKELVPSLKFYASACRKSSFSELLLSLCEKLKSAGVTPQALAKASFADKYSSQKLEDIKLIYTSYDAHLTKIYFDRSDELLVAAAAASETDFFAGFGIFIDGFDSFSGSQTALLEPMIRQSDEAHICLLSSVTSESDCFVSCERTRSRLTEFARKENKEVKEELLSGAYRYRSPLLKEVRDNICAASMKQSENTICDESVEIFEAKSVCDEADYIAAEISRLVRSRGMRYNEIAVLCEETEYFPHAFESACLKYGIPLFSDIPVSIKNKPLVKYISALIAAAETPSVENVMRLIKSGFVRVKNESGGTRPLSMREINDLERFVTAWELKSKSWERSFPDVTPSRKDRYDREKLELLRKQTAAPLMRLRKSCENKDGAQITAEIIHYLFDEADISAAIQGKCQDTSTSELLYNKLLTEEYNSLWEMLYGFFVSAHDTLSGFKMSLAEYGTLFRAVTASMNMAKPPQVLDSVLLGAPSRTRSMGARAVFAAGVNDGILPSFCGGEKSLFTEKENEQLRQFGIELEADDDIAFGNTYLPVYRAFTLASEKLTVSYHTEKDGRKSEAVQALTKIFTSLRIRKADSFGAEFYCATKSAARSYLSRNYFNSPEKCAGAEKALTELGDREYVARLLKAGMRNGTSHLHLGGDAARLITLPFSLSPTAIRTLNTCRFGYFCNYGLKLYEPDMHTIDFRSFGSAVHFALQYCFEKISGDGFKEAGSDALMRLTAEAFEVFRKDNFLAEEEASERFNVLYDNARRTAQELVVNIHKELLRSSFTPKYFELKLEHGKVLDDGFCAEPFRMEIPLGEKTCPVTVSGTVDRVDTADIDGKQWIRVVDYKTGSDSLDFSRIYYGLDLQLLLYLHTLCSRNTEYLPSSAVYLHIKGTPLEKENITDEHSARKAWLSENNETGIILAGSLSESEKAAYDEEFCSGRQKNFIRSDVVTQETLNAVMERASAATAENASLVLAGDVSAVPVTEKGKFDNCTYCRFSAICGRDPDNVKDTSHHNAKRFEQLVKENMLAAKDGENND